MTDAPVFDPLSPALWEDPYPLYRRLRDEDPVHRSPFGMWVLSRHADVLAALKDPRLGSRPSRFSIHAKRDRQNTPAAETARNMVTFLDPPEHTRLRRLLARVMTDNLAAGMRGRVQSLVDELLAPLLARGEMDIVNDFAVPLPVHVIADLLGIPPVDRPRLKEWSTWFFQIFSPVPSDETYQRLNQAIVEFREYLRDRVAERRRAPGQDVISSLIQVRDEQDGLSEDELLTSCILLFANGEEALSHLIGNGMLALLRHPAELARLRDHPDLIRSAVEELLRYDTPAPTVGRTATEAIEWHGKVIPAGSPVYLLLGAANRDPARFPEPDRLDLARQDNDHFGFGAGRHACLGAGIARVEAQVAIGSLIRATRDMTLAIDAPRWRPGVFIRGLQSLPVKFSVSQN